MKILEKFAVNPKPTTCLGGNRIFYSSRISCKWSPSKPHDCVKTPVATGVFKFNLEARMSKGEGKGEGETESKPETGFYSGFYLSIPVFLPGGQHGDAPVLFERKSTGACLDRSIAECVYI